MGASAAWQAAVKISGVATAMSGEATTLVSGTTYRITNAAKRVLDPNAAVVVKDGGTPVTPTSIDYLFGTATLPSPPGGAVTVDANYIPTGTFADAKSIDVSIQGNLLDKSTFGTQAKAKLLGLVDASATVARLTLPLDDIDPDTGGIQSIDSRMKAGAAMLLDWLVDGTNRVRAWLLVKSYKVTGQVDGLVEVSVEFEASAQAAGAVFGIGT